MGPSFGLEIWCVAGSARGTRISQRDALRVGAHARLGTPCAESGQDRSLRRQSIPVLMESLTGATVGAATQRLMWKSAVPTSASSSIPRPTCTSQSASLQAQDRRLRENKPIARCFVHAFPAETNPIRSVGVFSICPAFLSSGITGLVQPQFAWRATFRTQRVNCQPGRAA